MSFRAVFVYAARKVCPSEPYLATEAGRAARPVRNENRRQEKQMSTSIKFIAMAALLVTVAACARQTQDEFVVVDPEPISTEPAFTGKYK
jgi:hypothetical protein